MLRCNITTTPTSKRNFYVANGRTDDTKPAEQIKAAGNMVADVARDVGN